MVPAQQTLLMVTRTHQRFYTEQVSGVPSACLVTQPRNRGTAPAILYSLMRVRDVDPGGIVAFFPSDHHFAHDEALVAQMNLAFAVSESLPELVTLLGVVPQTPEVAYGWIEPGALLDNRMADPVFHISRFWEKPSQALASDLMRRGCLWNSFVMVGRVCAFFRLFQRALPDLLESFESMQAASLTLARNEALDDLYSRIPGISFSDSVLAVCPSDLAVLRGSGLDWSDLGEPARVTSLLSRRSVKPEWSLSPAGKATAAAAASAG